MVNQKTKQKGSQRPKLQHRFLNIREIILTSIGTSDPIKSSTDGSGQSIVRASFSPIGMKSVKLNGTSFEEMLVEPSHLRWLQNNSLNFGSFRVLRAKVIFVGNQGSTTTGQVTIACYRDVLDAGSDPYPGYVNGPNSKVFDLASASSKELSVNVPVDSSWKKVTANLAVKGATLPFTNSSNTGFVQVNSVNDLCFGSFSGLVAGAAANSTVGNWYLDYDVEFKEPMSTILNV